MQRPFVQFDPKNKEHRQLFFKFLRTSSWAHSPYQWLLDDDCVSVVHNILNKLTLHYTTREFKPVAKKQRKTIKIVDKKVLKINDLQQRKKSLAKG